ncbi:hypothetical protein GCM10011391_39400 [Pullulanibacillus camelliae]|uniref:DUF4183 domain-containing protein n=1 Tax=Pullulanibacillus camelliae TaxID=1707096 RepID=A0A8J2YN46_9BACL|nr:DUF4183 domain-containing protein [Pullulanibacillus camelliae]GGE56611.1 hypothetical protein GCM10011391_39400 [Pullulanibacillus camelliae]
MKPIQTQAAISVPPTGCPLIFPGISDDVKPLNVLKAQTYTYFTLADENKRLYTDDDELKAYGKLGILDPQCVSYYNLYINGILQPESIYQVKKGCLWLRSKDLPLKGTVISLQFILIYF